MSNSVRPHRRKPTRLPRPWDSPGKNTGVGCHFLLQCMKVKSEREFAQSCPTLSDPMDYSLPGSSIHGIFQARVLEWGAIAFSIPFSNSAATLVGSCCIPTLRECVISSVLSHHNKNLKRWTSVKALRQTMSQPSDRPCHSSQWQISVTTLRQISVTAPHRSVLFR